MKLAGITDFTRHDLRHDAATNLVESGASLIEVRDILGHSDIRMTQSYAHAKERGFIRLWRDWQREQKELSQICPRRFCRPDKFPWIDLIRQHPFDAEPSSL